MNYRSDNEVTLLRSRKRDSYVGESAERFPVPICVPVRDEVSCEGGKGKKPSQVSDQTWTQSGPLEDCEGRHGGYRFKGVEGGEKQRRMERMSTTTMGNDSRGTKRKVCTASVVRSKTKLCRFTRASLRDRVTNHENKSCRATCVAEPATFCFLAESFSFKFTSVHARVWSEI